MVGRIFRKVCESVRVDNLGSRGEWMKENVDRERRIKNRNRGRENGGRRNDEERSRVN